MNNLFKQATLAAGMKSQMNYGSHMAGIAATSAIGGLGAKKIQNRLKGSQQKTAEEITYDAFNDELTKLAEDPKRDNSEPPKWLSRAAEAGGFIMGAGIGATLGDSLITKATKAPSPNTVRLAKALGAGAIGTAGLLITPKLQQMTEKYLFGKEKKNDSRSNSN